MKTLATLWWLEPGAFHRYLAATKMLLPCPSWHLVIQTRTRPPLLGIRRPRQGRCLEHSVVICFPNPLGGGSSGSTNPSSSASF
jgi:hypothetical protein